MEARLRKAAGLVVLLLACLVSSGTSAEVAPSCASALPQPCQTEWQNVTAMVRQAAARTDYIDFAQMSWCSWQACGWPQAQLWVGEDEHYARVTSSSSRIPPRLHACMQAAEVKMLRDLVGSLLSQVSDMQEEQAQLKAQLLAQQAGPGGAGGGATGGGSAFSAAANTTAAAVTAKSQVKTYWVDEDQFSQVIEDVDLLDRRMDRAERSIKILNALAVSGAARNCMCFFAHVP